METDKKVQQALQLLKEASHEKRVELGRMLSDLCEKAKAAKESASSYIKDTAASVDQHVHDKAWHYVIGAALGGLCAGLFLRCRR